MKRVLSLFAVAAAVGGLSLTQSASARPDEKGKEEKKMVTTKSGLMYLDEKEGTGAEAKAGDSVQVHYTGTLKDGTMFDSSKKPGRTPFEFKLGAGMVIKGWDEGVAGMKV